ncbi:UDP-N-acetylglucosamine 2-epimerase (non-hydrolyzing) [Alkalibaculum sp. M08DMB]|uniref:UDP-N-acetylglucosamine 2-epimerase (Non-hydrolyzing) n=1 Tax=Alkalibaculum sporogenes TaxID=2655001 RepID=A0A6A7KD82_9FIRM|nr:UDP-N-acetylglucosamine 2-epimerase (non-hydrolyzing) [Alkalibaculum sporogenes]MPW26973.1 UDP-N-acetylglucosamine 2-epimerase (non-hydrolyzing) [Alkalibaculum sporogenes]
MKILTIIGARPQFVKEAIIQNEISKYNDIKEIVVHTGQHYDNNMSGIFFDVLNMKKPEYNLGIKASKHGEMTGKMLIMLEDIMIKETPDIVLLYGDTNSTLAGAIAASKLKIKIAHVEAGLRQEPKDMPEETNRVLTDRISDYLFTPSELGIENLKREGITNNVYFTGDVMYDVFLKMKPKFDYSLLSILNLEKDKYIMMTMHRDFNVDFPEKLEKILKGVNKISNEMKVVLPLHPRTKKRIKEFGLEQEIQNVKIIEPIDYLKLMGLTENCFKVITDSGGYQKEAYFAGKQAVIIMPDTSWRELTDSGLNKLTNEENIYNHIVNIEKKDYVKDIYGNGKAAENIISILKKS